MTLQPPFAPPTFERFPLLSTGGSLFERRLPVCVRSDVTNPQLTPSLINKSRSTSDRKEESQTANKNDLPREYCPGRSGRYGAELCRSQRQQSENHK